MRNRTGLSVAVALAAIVIAGLTYAAVTRDDDETAGHAGLIRVSSPTSNAVVTSPISVAGEARGTWFFEATFPVTLIDMDGRVLIETYATAQSDWMTEEFVAFTATVQFGNAAGVSKGTLVLKRSNPSGLPQFDDEIRVPVRFR